MHRSQSTAVIFDVAGFTSLISINEDYAIKRNLRLRTETIQTLVPFHGGEVMDCTGDGGLLRFKCAASALKCGIAIQDQLAALEEPVEPELRLRLRIGIDYGYVIETNPGIAGHHVNVAARLQALASNGGICLSERAYAGLETAQKTLCRFHGKFKLKHVNELVEVWSWSQNPTEPVNAAKPTPRLPKRPIKSASNEIGNPLPRMSVIKSTSRH